MAVKYRKVGTLTVELADKPGEFARLIGGLHEAKVELIAVNAFATAEGKATAHFVPKEVGQVEPILKHMGANPVRGDACLAEGDDRLGVFDEVLQKVKKAEINLTATDAMGTNGKFFACLWTKPEDLPKLCRTLGC